MLSLWNPLMIEKVKSDSKMSSKNYFDRLWSEPFETMFSDIFHNSGLGMEYNKNQDGTLSVSIDIPGIPVENINIEVSEDKILTVKGERKTAKSSHSVYKSINIPEGYDMDNIKAELKNGVLTLSLTEKATPQKEVKKITITSSE